MAETCPSSRFGPVNAVGILSRSIPGLGFISSSGCPAVEESEPESEGANAIGGSVWS